MIFVNPVTIVFYAKLKFIQVQLQGFSGASQQALWLPSSFMRSDVTTIKRLVATRLEWLQGKNHA